MPDSLPDTRLSGHHYFKGQIFLKTRPKMCAGYFKIISIKSFNIEVDDSDLLFNCSNRTVGPCVQEENKKILFLTVGPRVTTYNFSKNHLTVTKNLFSSDRMLTNSQSSPYPHFYL